MCHLLHSFSHFLWQGRNEYLGLVTVKPLVRMVPDSDEPVLEWFKIERYGKAAGDLLAAFELIRVR